MISRIDGFLLDHIFQPYVTRNAGKNSRSELIIRVWVTLAALAAVPLIIPYFTGTFVTRGAAWSCFGLGLFALLVMSLQVARPRTWSEGSENVSVFRGRRFPGRVMVLLFVSAVALHLTTRHIFPLLSSEFVTHIRVLSQIYTFSFLIAVSVGLLITSYIASCQEPDQQSGGDQGA